MLTIVLAVYGQPKMLAFQMENFASFPDDVRAQVEWRIVDDHGTPPAEVDPDFAAENGIQLFRVLEDIPWNQMSARNIGMREARDGVCVMLDPDMVISKDMIGRFLVHSNELQRGNVVKFGLNHVSGGRELDFSSPNTFLLHKADFFHCGGYDEDFRGHKGWSDCLLQETLRAFYHVHEDRKLYVDFYLPSDGYDDAMVLSLDRDVSFNKRLKIAKNESIRRFGGFKRYIARRLKGPNFRCQVKRIL